MLVVEKVSGWWPFSVTARAYCAAPFSFSVGIHGSDALGACKFTRTDYTLAAGEKVLLKVRRPAPAVREVVDTSTVLKVETFES